MDRSVDAILVDWRTATAEREDVTFDPDLEARIEALRLELVAAVEEQRQAAFGTR